MPNIISDKTIFYLFAIVGGVIGFIGSIMSILAAIGYIGVVISLIIAVISFVVGYIFFIKRKNEKLKIPPRMKIITHGNHSPGIVGGNYEVLNYERERPKH